MKPSYPWCSVLCFLRVGQPPTTTQAWGGGLGVWVGGQAEAEEAGCHPPGNGKLWPDPTTGMAVTKLRNTGHNPHPIFQQKGPYGLWRRRAFFTASCAYVCLSNHVN